MPISVLMMPWGRVGSNMVNAVLADHGAKVFNEPLTGIQSRNSSLHRADIANLQLAWLNEKMVDNNQVLVLNHAAISSADPDELARWFDKHSPNIITLDRRDDLAVALSSARTEEWVAEGRRTGEKRSWSVSQNIVFRPLIFPEKVRQNLLIVREGRRLMQQLIGSLESLDIWYEDLLHDRTGAITAILRAVGVSKPLELQVKSSRFGSDYISKLVSNPIDFVPLLEEEKGRTSLLI